MANQVDDNLKSCKGKQLKLLDRSFELKARFCTRCGYLVSGYYYNFRELFERESYRNELDRCWEGEQSTKELISVYFCSNCNWLAESDGQTRILNLNSDNNDHYIPVTALYCGYCGEENSTMLQWIDPKSVE